LLALSIWLSGSRRAAIGAARGVATCL